MSQGNHMGLDLGSHQVLYLDRSKLGAESVDVRSEDGNRRLTQLAALESGIITKFLYSGKVVQLLTPKKDEVDLWSVEVTGDKAVSTWRLDMILGAQRATTIQPGPAPVPPTMEGEFIASDD
jgi:hypothetical protein